MGDIPRLQDFDDPAYDPFIEDALMFGDDADPYPRMAQLRRQAPVHRNGYRALMGGPPDITCTDRAHVSVFAYDEVAQVLADPLTFSNQAYAPNLGVAFGRSVSVMDAPDHPRYRRMFQKAFLPHIVAGWGESLVDPVVEALMAQFQENGRADLVGQFTLHYPFQVIYRQLQLPPADVKVFHKLALAQTVVVFDLAHGMEASAKLGTYFSALVAERRARPGADLVSMLACAEVDGEYLPEEILISFLRQLVNAGGDTTYRATSVLLCALLRHPEQLEAVRRDRTLVAKAIDEALRWDGPVVMQARMATCDVTLGGIDIAAGTYVDVVAGAANRYETRFPDPDRFDVLRAPTARHFGFAYGPHVCIGQHLARVEMTRALNAILDRLPGVRLDPTMAPPAVQGIMMRVPASLDVVFDALAPDKHRAMLTA